METNNIYTTLSNRRLHIAADHGLYLGSVDSYNNCITQFFAWLFGLSIAVDFGGQQRIVNAASYDQLLRTLCPRVEAITQRHLFRNVIATINPPDYREKMWRKIAHDDSLSLLARLGQAIADNDVEAARKWIGKGANLDVDYFAREGYPPVLRLSEKISRKGRVTVFLGPPIAHAAKSNNNAIVNLLRDAGATINIEARSYEIDSEGAASHGELYTLDQHHCLIKANIPK